MRCVSSVRQFSRPLSVSLEYRSCFKYENVFSRYLLLCTHNVPQCRDKALQALAFDFFRISKSRSWYFGRFFGTTVISIFYPGFFLDSRIQQTDFDILHAGELAIRDMVCPSATSSMCCGSCNTLKARLCRLFIPRLPFFRLPAARTME